MRAILALAALLLAGCSSDAPANADLPDTEGGAEDPAAVAQPAPVELVQRDLARIPVPASSAGSATGSVAIPNGTTSVEAVPEFAAAAMASMSVEVAGCGTAEFDVLTASISGTIGAQQACAAATPGEQGVTIAVEGAYEGYVVIRAMVPADA